MTPQFLEKAETKVAPVKPNETNGTVLVIFWTSESGTVVSVRALDGPAGLQKAATEAIYKWKFKPMSVNGQPVQMGSAVSVDSSQTTAVMQAPKPMTAAQLSPGFQPKCFDGLVREEPTSVKVCQHQLDEQQLGKSTEAEKDFAVAENSLREAEKAIGNEKIAAYYHERLTRIVAPHATHLGACKVPIKALLRQRASRAEEEWRVRPGSVLFGVDRRRPLAHG